MATNVSIAAGQNMMQQSSTTNWQNFVSDQFTVTLSPPPEPKNTMNGTAPIIGSTPSQYATPTNGASVMNSTYNMNNTANRAAGQGLNQATIARIALNLGMKPLPPGQPYTTEQSAQIVGLFKRRQMLQAYASGRAHSQARAQAQAQARLQHTQAVTQQAHAQQVQAELRANAHPTQARDRAAREQASREQIPREQAAFIGRMTPSTSHDAPRSAGEGWQLYAPAQPQP
jgi:hypothetical protein